MMYYYYDYFPFHMFSLGFFFIVLFWGLIIYGAYLFFKHNRTSDKNRALEILKERYVKGEITKAEFEAMKKDLQ